MLRIGPQIPLRDKRLCWGSYFDKYVIGMDLSLPRFAQMLGLVTCPLYLLLSFWGTSAYPRLLQNEVHVRHFGCGGVQINVLLLDGTPSPQLAMGRKVT